MEKRRQGETYGSRDRGTGLVLGKGKQVEMGMEKYVGGQWEEVGRERGSSLREEER